MVELLLILVEFVDRAAPASCIVPYVLDLVHQYKPESETIYQINEKEKLLTDGGLLITFSETDARRQ